MICALLACVIPIVAKHRNTVRIAFFIVLSYLNSGANVIKNEESPPNIECTMCVQLKIAVMCIYVHNCYFLDL